MAFNGRNRKVGNTRIIDTKDSFNFISEPTEACSQNKTQLRPEVCSLLQEAYAFLDTAIQFGVFIIHNGYSLSRLFLVAQGAAQNFTHIGFGKLVAKFDILGDFISGQVGTTVANNLIHGEAGIFSYDKNFDYLA